METNTRNANAPVELIASAPTMRGFSIGIIRTVDPQDGTVRHSVIRFYGENGTAHYVVLSKAFEGDDGECEARAQANREWKLDMGRTV